MCASHQTSPTPDTASAVDVGVKPGGGRGGVVDACVVLAGGIRASALTSACGRSVLDLHLTHGRTVLEWWIERVRGVVGVWGVLIAHGGDVPMPVLDDEIEGVRLVADAGAYRGPAGVVRDACDGIAGGGSVLIVEAARWAGCGVGEIVRRHRSSGAAVTVGINPDGTPAGVYLATRDAIGVIERVGYIDIKEQWVPRAVRAGMRVRGHVLAAPGAMELRSAAGFLAASRAASGGAGGSVVCDGARVDAGAELIDSIVMPGGVVERGAVVARAVVAPGGRVRGGEGLVDAVASAGTEHNTRRVLVAPPGLSPGNPGARDAGAGAGAPRSSRTIAGGLAA